MSWQNSSPNTTMSSSPKRCAVYCRVSSDERLDQSFNSIDAQKESGRAFIASHRAEGWIPVANEYDDPGYSGGNTDRPAFKRLMHDVEAGQVDIIVVYKIDRLTRSLSDFAKMIEVFDRRGVSFSSVTQQINSATSMGRLMLNVLLSFAQFEREVTSERIRDKFAASKRKGLWMGGTPPLGYDVVQRRLVVNESEAKVVRRIFQEMLTIGSPTKIAAALGAEGVTTKAWTTKTGRHRAGGPMDKKYMHALLRNRIYLGEISYKGSWHAAEHLPIIERSLWDRVHEVLSTNSHARSVRTKMRARSDSLLRGLLFSPSGEKMYPTHTSKNGRRYAYYTSASASRFSTAQETFSRVPAALVEGVVVQQICDLLNSAEAIAAVVGRTRRNPSFKSLGIDEAAIVVSMRRLSHLWEQLFPQEQHRIVNLLVQRVDLVDDGSVRGVRVKWHEMGWDELTSEFDAQGICTELAELLVEEQL